MNKGQKGSNVNQINWWDAANPSQIAYWFVHSMCAANCIGKSYNVKIIRFLHAIWNGLPNDAHELMGSNKAAIIDKMLAVPLTPEILVRWKLGLKLVSKQMEHKE